MTNLNKIFEYNISFILFFLIAFFLVPGCSHVGTTRNLAQDKATDSLCLDAFEAMETSAREAQKNGQTELTRTQLIKLADQYLHANKYQEAIWTLRRAGEEARAEQVTKDLETRLREGKPIKWTFLGGNAYRVDLDNGISGVHKGIVGYNYEIATYKIDRRLGLNIVPLTIERNFGKPGSFQYFVADTKDPGGLNPFNPQGQQAYYLTTRPYGIKEQRFLDEWVDQRDRKQANFGIRTGNQIVSWDNMNAYLPNQGVSDASERWMPSASVWTHFQAYSPDEIRRDLESHLKPAEIDRLIRRREFMLQVGNRPPK